MNIIITEETIKEELVKLVEAERLGNPLYAEILKKCTVCFNDRTPFFSLTAELTLYVNTENYQKTSNNEKLSFVKNEIREIALLTLSRK